MHVCFLSVCKMSNKIYLPSYDVDLQGVWLDIIFVPNVPEANYNSPEIVYLIQEAYTVCILPHDTLNYALYPF